MTITYTFNSKETYLAARAEWKANYAQLTIDAREARREYNNAQKEFSKAPAYVYGAGAEVNKQHREAERKIWDTLKARAQIRDKANNALAELDEMKREAGAQWLAQRDIMIAATKLEALHEA